jgi:hypothetical protein
MKNPRLRRGIFIFLRTKRICGRNMPQMRAEKYFQKNQTFFDLGIDKQNSL